MNDLDPQDQAVRRRLLLQAAVAFGLAGSLPTVRAQDAPAQLRIGFQKSAVNLVVLKQQGALEKRFPATRVQWVEFPAGPQLLEALAVGSLEFGLTGDTPPVFAQAAGKDLLYVGAEPAKPLSSAILVPPDSPLRSLGDLKGRRIALQKGSSSHYLLVRALHKAGLSWSDIQPVYLPPADARAAFERGSVDAWVIWDPYYAATELALRPRVLTDGRGLTGNNSFYLASRPLVHGHPQVVQALLAELSAADAWVQAHRKEAAQQVADFSGLSLATVHRFIARRPASPVRPLDAAAAREQQRVADTFRQLGLIPQPIQVADIVWQPGREGPALQAASRTAP
ncbi:sulfonate ABC transporter substrate-binding protein [Eleftheria terrae]|uniref:sulfonate ABC transporter substrate-binding protein n=1 Tax=Eleftheria terrae TaxID=1597781 RepID=UPI00263B98EA|nr:sulfonate ABC transporter substrate-binding protein [Eleftheria terrae]WKB54709.1 sulfonate ABC transporter substrate-binding protein [Eleftheria terrae]